MSMADSDHRHNVNSIFISNKKKIIAKSYLWVEVWAELYLCANIEPTQTYLCWHRHILRLKNFPLALVRLQAKKQSWGIKATKKSNQTVNIEEILSKWTRIAHRVATTIKLAIYLHICIQSASWNA